MDEQDKDWIRGMVNCDDYADDIIKYVENIEKNNEEETELKQCEDCGNQVKILKRHKWCLNCYRKNTGLS